MRAASSVALSSSSVLQNIKPTSNNPNSKTMKNKATRENSTRADPALSFNFETTKWFITNATDLTALRT
jgi:hypothetical protein